MTDQHASTGPEKPKYYIAESYRQFRDWCRHHNITASDRQFIASDRTERLMGLYLHPSQVEICYDPRAPWSFWVELQRQMLRCTE